MFQQMMINKIGKESIKTSSDVINRIKNKGKDINNVNEDTLYEICQEILNLDPNKISPELEKAIRFYCDSIEGVCYFLGLEVGFLRGGMAMRSAQYCALIDKYLYSYKLNRCSQEVKEKYYKKLQLFEVYKEAPGLFIAK